MNNKKHFEEVKRDVTEGDVIAWLKKRVIELRADYANHKQNGRKEYNDAS